MHGLRVDRAIHNYLYFTQYDRYVKWFLGAGRMVVRRMSRLPLLARAFQAVYDRYHAKVLAESDAAKIFSLEKSLALGPEAAERVIPFPYANRIILSEPDYIAIMDCPCRLARENPCRPVNVCIAVGRTTAQFWLEHGEKYHARKATQQEALELVRSERARGHITTAWFKVATGGRTGVICSCCACCCGGLEAMRLVQQVKGGEKMSNLIPSGYAVETDPEKCAACGKCIEHCMFGAITPDQEGDPIYDREACYGCGLCVELCENKAKTLALDGKKGMPLDLEMLKEKEMKTNAG